MTRISPRVAVVLMLVLVFANLALRYPSAQHEGGADSFVFHGLAQVVLDSHHAEWLINPLSLFGLYPLSHPSGSILMVVASSELGDVQAEASVLLLDFLCAVLGLFGSFMMAREIRRDDRLALLVAFLFSTAPRFVTSLEWQVPTRSLFTAVVPLFVWGLLRLHRHFDILHIALLSTLLVVMMTAHRLAVMMAIVMTAYVAASIFIVVVRILRTRYASIFLAPRSRYILRVGSWCTVALVGVYFLLFSGVLGAYEEGQVGSGSGALVQLANLGISLARTVGFLVPLVLFGAIAVLRSREMDVRQPWLIAVLIGILPTLSLRQYTGSYLVPFAAIFIALGIVYLVSRVRNRPYLRAVIVSGIVLVSVASTLYIVNYERQVEQYLTSPVYTSGLYLRHAAGGAFISNSGALGVQAHAVSGLPYLPIGGSTTAFQGPEILAFGFLTPNDVRPRLIPLGSLTIEDDSFFTLDNVNFEVTWADILTKRVSDPFASQQLARYDIQYFLESRSLSGEFEAYGNTYNSPFALTVSAERYIFFDNGGFSLYYLQGNGS